MPRYSPKMRQAMRLWRNINDAKQDTIQRIRGILGDGTGAVRVTNRPDLVYMRINADSTKILKIVNDKVADINNLPVIAEKHPDSRFWEVIDIDKEALINSGVGLSSIKYTQTHHLEHEWPDYDPGPDVVNVYRRAFFDLRVEPTFPSYSLSVVVRPLVYAYQGIIKRYRGGLLDLSSYVPVSGIRRVLTYLDIRTNYMMALPGPPVAYSVNADPPVPIIPWYAKSSGLVILRENQVYVTESDIESIPKIIDEDGIKHNLQAGSAPTTSDDALLGYSEGSMWIYGSSIYFCTNPAIGAAVWTSTSGVSTPIAIADGGTGQTTAQAAIDALTQVSGATNEHVLTKDTASGNAIFKAGGGAVSSVFGRTGAIIAAASDYDANQVDVTPTGNISSTDVQAALAELDSEKSPTGHTHDVILEGNSSIEVLDTGTGQIIFEVDAAQEFHINGSGVALATGQRVSDIDTTPANNSAALITSSGVYAHTNASAAVHGLPANVNVLGHRAGSGHYIQQGTVSISPDTAATIYTESADNSVTFPVAFSSAPIVLSCIQDQANSFCGVKSITTTGCAIRGGAGTAATNTAGWVAFSP